LKLLWLAYSSLQLARWLKCTSTASYHLQYRQVYEIYKSKLMGHLSNLDIQTHKHRDRQTTGTSVIWPIYQTVHIQCMYPT